MSQNTDQNETLSIEGYIEGCSEGYIEGCSEPGTLQTTPAPQTPAGGVALLTGVTPLGLISPLGMPSGMVSPCTPLVTPSWADHSAQYCTPANLFDATQATPVARAAANDSTTLFLETDSYLAEISAADRVLETPK